MVIMQGDSYPIYMELMQDDNCLKPEMVTDLEVCLGMKGSAKPALRKLHSKQEVSFDKDTEQWSFRPKQEETLALEKGHYNVEVRIRYKNSNMEDVVGLKVGTIEVIGSISEAVI